MFVTAYENGDYIGDLDSELWALYDDVVIDCGFHPDDDFESIHEIMYNRLTS